MATLSEALEIAIDHHQAGQLQAAENIYRQILAQDPNQPDALHLLGVIAHQTGHHDAAVELIRHAIALRPLAASYFNNLGAAYRALGNLDEVVACCRRAIDLKPDYGDACNNLGIALKDQGRLDDAIGCYQDAIELVPDDASLGSNLLYTIWFSPDYDAASLQQEHVRWHRRYAAPLAKLIGPHTNDRSPDRRLRVGYVSPDFRMHSVGRFLLPLVESHDRQQLEIFCYSSVPVPDEMTERFRAAADVWRDVAPLADQALADLVRQDRIDILVDLTMHMAGNRLLVFARKPAPVQVTYLAYSGTTGLAAIDYRLSDPYLDPPGREEPYYSEQSIRLPETYWCYRPVCDPPEVNELPALEAGHVTFACLNNFCKVTPPAVDVWIRVLKAVPGSRLVLHARQGSHRRRIADLFADRAVAADRVEFLDLLPTAEYLRIYQRVDIGLDPFPYGGGATTCDALWMGVPVVSLAGSTPVGRAGLSILSNAGVPELVARDPSEYLSIATGLAGDLGRLSGLRAGLRERMRQSPLMDQRRFAAGVEAAFRQMWRRWCDPAADAVSPPAC